MTTHRDEQPNKDADHPLLSRVVIRNIKTIHRLRRDAIRARGMQGRLADWITAFSGSMTFVYVHVIWFALWIAVNLKVFDKVVGRVAFDPFPFGLLTLIVSLEAIFLATFLLISQNRQSKESEHRADLALQIGLLTEHELTRVLQMLDAIQCKLKITDSTTSDLADLEVETKPEDVLAEISRLQDSV